MHYNGPKDMVLEWGKSPTESLLHSKILVVYPKPYFLKKLANLHNSPHTSGHNTHVTPISPLLPIILAISNSNPPFCSITALKYRTMALGYIQF